MRAEFKEHPFALKKPGCEGYEKEGGSWRTQRAWGSECLFMGPGKVPVEKEHHGARGTKVNKFSLT